MSFFHDTEYTGRLEACAFSGAVSLQPYPEGTCPVTSIQASRKPVIAQKGKSWFIPMNAGSFLKRTKQTNLSEEELLILDALFDARDRFESLLRENYARWHNLPYSHNLGIEVLSDLLDRLVDRGIISSHPSGFDGSIFYGLTTAGGQLWEAERVPNWERYCTDYSTEAEAGHWVLSVESPSAATAQEFMHCARHCRLYGFKQEEIKTTTWAEEQPSTVYWKTFSAVYSLSVPTYTLPDPNPVDWQEYERKRSWWRNLAELSKFQVL